MWKGRVSGQTGLEAREVSMVGLGGVVDNWMKGRLYGMAFVWLLVLELFYWVECGFATFLSITRHCTN